MGTPKTINGIAYDGDDSNITQIKYERSVSLNVSVSRGYGNAPVIFHPVYGINKWAPAPDFIPKASQPWFLKLPKPGGGFYTQSEAYDILKQDDFAWVKSLPVLSADVGSQYIEKSNFHPINEVPEDTSGLFILRKIYDVQRQQYQYSNALPYDAIWWGYTGYTEWKHQGLPNTYQELNPLWQDNETLRTQQRQDYEDALKAKFQLHGPYIFQGLPTNEIIIPSLIADTALQIAYWDKFVHAKIPDPNWIPPTQAEIEALRKAGQPIPTAPLITTWKEANRWTAETIPSQFLYKWHILQGGEWKDIPVMNDYWLAVIKDGSKTIHAEVPNNVNLSVWDSKVSFVIQKEGQAWLTYAQQLKKLLGL